MAHLPKRPEGGQFTDRWLKAHDGRPFTSESELNERRGFGVRVSPKGTIAFQYRFRHQGRKQRMHLGTYPDTTLAEARERHEAARKHVDQGRNPIQVQRDEAREAERRRQEEQRRAEEEARRETVRELADEFMARFVETGRRRPDHVRQMLYGSEKHRLGVLNDIGDLKAKAITRRDVVRALDKIVDRGARVQANRTAAVLKQMFQYGVERGIVEDNPAAAIRIRTIGGKEQARDRALSHEEIRALWNRIEAVGEADPETGRRPWVGLPMAKALKLLLTTGQRRGELVRAQWADIDFEHVVWTIPAKNSKTGREHIVPLSPLALALFRDLRAMAGDSAYVLPSREGTPQQDTPRNRRLHPTPRGEERADKPVTERALSKAALRGQAVVGIAKWTPHDLRRTVRTELAALGVRPEVAEKVLGHELPKMLRVYDRHDYREEKRDALEKWAERIELIGAGDAKVVPLNATRQGGAREAAAAA